MNQDIEEIKSLFPPDATSTEVATKAVDVAYSLGFGDGMRWAEDKLLDKVN